MTQGQPILTAAAMRDAELATAAGGTSLATLMDRAGGALARLAWRIASGRPIHILVGPGNNGGDGYVAARVLADMGAQVQVSALSPPTTLLAQVAAAGWTGEVRALSESPLADAVLVDCLFGTGLNRRLDAAVIEALAAHTNHAARIIAADLPSGVDSDAGADFGCPYHADVTLAFGALKPAHLLYPAAARMGRVMVDAIGIACTSLVRTGVLPDLTWPDHDSHKYVRGLVAVIAGSMGGAAELAARAALRSGAGYVRLIGSGLPPTAPHAVVRQGWRDGAALNDPRIGAVVIGCGLGQGESAAMRFAAAQAINKPMVVDADALALIGDAAFTQPAIVTPHPGEFDRLMAESAELAGHDKISKTQTLAARLNAVVIHKGPDTVIAAPDGQVAVASPGNSWLSTAGTGDVLAGIAGAMLARGLPPFAAAQAAVLLHQRAAKRTGPGLMADDLIAEPIWP